MGDSEQTSAGDGENSPVVASQTVIANNAISGSEVAVHHHSYHTEVTFVNLTVINVPRVDHCESCPEQGEQCAGQQSEGDKDSDDTQKDLTNSLSLSGSHERHVDGNNQGDEDEWVELRLEDCAHPGHQEPPPPIEHSYDPGEYENIELPEKAPMAGNPDAVLKTQPDSPRQTQLLPGQQMPADCSCRISPHSCKVYCSKVVKCTQRFGRLGQFIRKESRCTHSVCLVSELDLVCISSSTNKNVIKYVFDTAKEPPQLNARDLTIGSLVVTLPEHELSEWKKVIDQQRKLSQTLSPSTSYEDDEVKEAEECTSVDEPSYRMGTSSPSTPHVLAYSERI